MVRAAVVALCFMAATGCDSSNPAAPGPLDAQVRLAPGQGAFLGGTRVSIRFIEVLSDSRCPINALCIVPGEAVARVVLAERGAPGETHDVATGKSQRSELLDADVTFVQLSPYPASIHPIPQSDYRATFRITR